MTHSHSRQVRESKTSLKVNYMNKIFKISALALAGIMAFASCKEEPVVRLTDKGPDMTIVSCSESAYMGGSINFSVDLQDSEFALSTLKVKLLFDETEVANTIIRTKEYGTYDESIQVPLMKNIPNGTATLVFTSQNVGTGLSYDTVYVACQRPDPEKVTLKIDGSQDIILEKTEDYQYSVTGDFPALIEAFVNVEAGNETVVLGWNGSNLVVNGANPVPFSAGVAGKYTLAINLMDLSASPLGNAAVVSVEHYTQGQNLDFGGVVDIANWNLDYDFFEVNEDFTECKFRAVDGLYKFDYRIKDKYIMVEPMADEDNVLTLSPDGSGAVWVIGSGMGKPVIGPSWNTTEGAYPMAQVADKIYQFTLTAPGMVDLSSADFKFFHQKGWGGEFLKPSYAEINLAPYFDIPADDGNIKAKDLKSGKSYKITLDLTGGVNAAKVSCEEITIAVSGLDIQVNGVKADKMSETVYKVPAVAVEQNGIISFSGIENPQEWYVDPDHFEISAEGLKFRAVSGYYSFELNLEGKYVTVRRVTSEGKAATYANEGAITFMGWGVGHPSITKPLAWDGGQLITLAEIEPGKYQFTGIAGESTDETYGVRWQYDAELSFKFFGQAGWGAEWGTVTLTDEAKKWLEVYGNVELIGKDRKADDSGWETRYPLELGATYVMTVTDCTPLDSNSKFNCTIDFRKK